MNHLKVLITGSDGFVGQHLFNELISNGATVYRISNSTDYFNQDKKFTFEQFFSPAFNNNFDVVIHLAGAAHRTFSDEEARNTNFILTKKVIDKCINLKIPKFIFLSTANVYQEQVSIIHITSDVSSNLLNTNYNKLLAENYIMSKSDKGFIDSVIIRSPLIYGENVKANFASLMRFVAKGLPLPFRCIKKNKRSLISVYNLVDLIKVCIEHPKAVNQVFLVSDDDDLSTAQMITLMAKVQGKHNLALPVPVWCFKLLGKLLNKRDVIDRFTGSLQLDITHTKNTLD